VHFKKVKEPATDIPTGYEMAISQLPIFLKPTLVDGHIPTDLEFWHKVAYFQKMSTSTDFH